MSITTQPSDKKIENIWTYAPHCDLKKTFVIATCREWPQGNADLRTLAQALNAALIPWQDIKPTECIGKTILPLAAWDYSLHVAAYRQWLNTLHAYSITVINPPVLQHWNVDKRYLIALADQNLPVTPSIALLPGQNWHATLTTCSWPNPVIKPLIGQSGRGVRRLQDGLPNAREYPDGVLLQAFVHAPFGEVCLVYFDGQFSHAVHRKPSAHEWRTNSAYGMQILPIDAQETWRQCGDAVMQALPQMPHYARIDGLVDVNNTFWINEVELIEPALYLSIHENALNTLLQALTS